MKKIKLIFTTIVCITMIVVNIISNSNGNDIFSVSLSNIVLNATADPEVDSGNGYELIWNGHCNVCTRAWSTQSNCDISAQCCDNQQPYC